MFANVRGYQIAGTNYAHSTLSSASRQRGVTAAEGEGA
jgi:hypothetical protein